MDVESCVKEYENELYSQLNPYEMWIKENEGVSIVTRCRQGECEPFVIFYERNGELSSDANKVFTEYFTEHKDCAFAYCDEDVIKEGKRSEPWFKPEFSIDTILSVNYFGSVFAVKRNLILDILNDIHNKLDDRFDFIRKCEIDSDLANVYRIPFGEKDYEIYWNIIRVITRTYMGGHIDKVLFHAGFSEIISKNIVHNRFELLADTRLSIIIPSKDNPEMLFECIKSVLKCSKLSNEIVVVDNGSSEVNKNKIEEYSKQLSFTYLYKQMDFNFSKMCNLGAMSASGNVFLFLNDDITVNTDGFDVIMAGQALQALTGAVGAKLYYPDSTVIQHVGITNMGIGPAHKLCGVDDNGKANIYHGRNLADYNVYAVTAAALCVTKEKYAEVLCFDEKLSVAYNDVDLCFKLYEHGYFNIIRNDVLMYHHESVSRGNDESKEKKARLKKERDILYRNHPDAYKTDPFYSKHLVQERYDGEYNIGYLYPHETFDILSEVEYIDAPKDSSGILMRKIMRKGPVCQLNLDSVSYNENYNVFVLDGWAGLTDSDECLYDRHILLRDKNSKAYKISVFNKLREDAVIVMPNQKYNRLLGYS